MSHFKPHSIYLALGRRYVDAWAAAGFKFHPTTMSTQLHHAFETDSFRRTCQQIMGDPVKIRNKAEAACQLEPVIEWLHEEAKFPEPYSPSGIGYREMLSITMAFLEYNQTPEAVKLLSKVCWLLCTSVTSCFI
jgi:hypothetical protein